MSAQAVTEPSVNDSGALVVTHPEWCTDHSAEHREDNVDVRMINEVVAAVWVESRHPGPRFGQVRVIGAELLPIGRCWEYEITSAFGGSLNVAVTGREDDGITQLIRDLTQANSWIEAHQ